MLKTESIIKSLEEIGNGAFLSKSYIVMSVLAALFASYGFFTHQLAVIMGSMIVSMLLGPAIAASLALVQRNYKHLLRALMTEMIGFCIIYGAGFLVSFVWKGIPVTEELLAFTKPAGVDFVIATMSGIVATTALLFPSQRLAYIGANLAISMAPPITASATLLAYGSIALSANAFLVGLYNLLGAIFGSFITLLTIKNLERRWDDKNPTLEG